MAHAYKRGKYWHVRYKRPDGTYGSASRDDGGNRFTSERAAEQWGTAQETDVRRGTWKDPRRAETTLNDWLESWGAAQDLGLKSRSNYRYIIETYIQPEFGHRALGDIKASEIAAWEQKLIAAGYSRDGVPKSARTRLTTILGDAVVEGLIDTNPALRQKRRGRRSGVGTAGRKAEKVWASPLQALLFAERLSVLSGRDDDFIMAITAAYTAARWGELMGLQPDYVRLGHIRIDWQLVELKGGFYLLPPKDDSNRDIHLPQFLAGLLSRHLRARPDQRCACEPRTVEGQTEQPCQGGRRFVFLGPGTYRSKAKAVVTGHIRNSNYARRYVDPAADGWYVGEERRGKPRPARRVMVDLGEGHLWPGTPWRPAWPAPEPGQPFEPPKGHGWRRVEEGAVLASWAPIMRGLTPHGLRHGHKTWLAELGVPEILQADRMGHVVPGMRGVYTHISDGMVADMLAGLTRLWEESLAARAAIYPWSPVAVLNELLAPYRTVGRSSRGNRAETRDAPSG